MESMVATAIQVKVRVNRSPLSRVSAFTYTATQGIAMEAILGHDHDIYYQMVGPKNQMVGPETYQMASFSPPPPEL